MNQVGEKVQKEEEEAGNEEREEERLRKLTLGKEVQQEEQGQLYDVQEEKEDW